MDKNKQKKVLLIAGVSGSGKSHLTKHLLEEGFSSFCTRTTRPIRDGEVDGVNYDFTSRKDFEKLIAEGAMVEYAEVHGNYYGVSTKDLEAACKRGNIFVVLDPAGVDTYQKHFSALNEKEEEVGWSVVTVFIDCPESLKIERIKARLSDTPTIGEKTEVAQRLSQIDKEVNWKDLVKADIYVPVSKSANDIVNITKLIEDKFKEKPSKKNTPNSPKVAL